MMHHAADPGAMTGTLTGTAAGTFAAVFAALLAAHWLADHWVQTDHQAAFKSLPNRRGWLALLGHVATYTAVAAVFLLIVAVRLGLRLELVPVLTGLVFSAVTHGWADRRRPLAWLARHTGSAKFYRVAAGGISGAYLLDQSFHTTMLFVAALIIS